MLFVKSQQNQMKYIYLYEQHSGSIKNHNGLGWQAYIIQ